MRLSVFEAGNWSWVVSQIKTPQIFHLRSLNFSWAALSSESVALEDGVDAGFKLVKNVIKAEKVGDLFRGEVFLQLFIIQHQFAQVDLC